MAKFKDIIKLQQICCYSLTNLIWIQRTRSYDNLVTDIKALLFITHEQRVEYAKVSTANIEGVSVLGFDTLLVDLATDLNINTIIRGLRAVSDFEYELQMGYANSSINDTLETLYLMPTLENAFVSSTIVREIIRFDGKFQHLVPVEVLECM